MQTHETAEENRKVVWDLLTTGSSCLEEYTVYEVSQMGRVLPNHNFTV